MHPGRSATVARHDPAALPRQTRRAVDELIEGRLLSLYFRGGAAEPDFSRIARGNRDVEWIVPHCAVGVEVTAALRPTSDVRIWEAGAAHIVDRKICSESSPR